MLYHSATRQPFFKFILHWISICYFFSLFVKNLIKTNVKKYHFTQKWRNAYDLTYIRKTNRINLTVIPSILLKTNLPYREIVSWHFNFYTNCTCSNQNFFYTKTEYKCLVIYSLRLGTRFLFVFPSVFATSLFLSCWNFKYIDRKTRK